MEAMSVTGLLYTSSTYFTNRYRPYAYSEETPTSWRTRGGAKNSFYAGHVGLVATSTFFMGQGLCRLLSGVKDKMANIWTCGCGYWYYGLPETPGRVSFSNRHSFRITQGTLSGILVPHFHKNKLFKDPNLSITPYSNGQSSGFAMRYKFQ